MNKERVEFAEEMNSTLHEQILKATGLQISGFQYSLTGKENYRVEVDCEDTNQLGKVYDIVKAYADLKGLRLESGTVEMIPDFHRAILVLKKN